MLVVYRSTSLLYVINLATYNNASQGLNLITCTGDWIGTGSNRTLNKRILVFATLKTDT
jgi:hypothetical protein